MKPSVTRSHSMAAVNVISALALAAFAIQSSQAATLTLNSSDPFGSSSFTSPMSGSAPAGWGGGANAPASGNDYVVSGASAITLRGPANNTSYTFAGNSLTIGTNGTFSLKNNAANGAGILTVNNLILSGGTVNQDSGTVGNIGTLAGNITTSTSTTSSLNTKAGEIFRVNSTISGSGDLKIGTASGYNGTVSLNAANGSYSGATTLNRGALLVGTNTSLGTGSFIMSNSDSSATTTVASADSTARVLANQLGTFAGTSATYAFGQTSGGTGNLSFTNTTATSLGGAVRTFQIDNAQTQFSMGFTSAGGITKTGNGTMILSGASTYTGATTVSAGTLLVNGSTSSSSAVTVNAGATLGGTGTVGGFTTVNGNLNPGNSPGVLTFSNGLTLNGTTNMEINGTATAGTDFDKVVVSAGTTTFGGALAFSFGNLLADNTTINLFNFAGTSQGNFSGVTSTGSYVGTWVAGLANDTWILTSGNQTLTFSEVTGSLSVVPEPATWALMAFGLTLGMVLRRRRA